MEKMGWTLEEAVAKLKEQALATEAEEILPGLERAAEYLKSQEEDKPESG